MLELLSDTVDAEYRRDTSIVGTLDGIADVSDDRHKRNSFSLGSSCDTHNDLPPETLTVQFAFSGENHVGIGKQFIELHGIQNDLDTHFKVSIEECDHSSTHPTSSTCSRKL